MADETKKLINAPEAVDRGDARRPGRRLPGPPPPPGPDGPRHRRARRSARRARSASSSAAARATSRPSRCTSGRGLADAAAVGNVFASPGPRAGDGRGAGGGRRRGGPVPLRQLRRRRDELRHGRRAAGGRGHRGAHRARHRRRRLGARRTAPTSGAASPGASSSSSARAPPPTWACPCRRSSASRATPTPRVRSMGVALSPCSLPQTRRPNFEIPARRDGGRHGHPRRARHRPAAAGDRRRRGRPPAGAAAARSWRWRRATPWRCWSTASARRR